MPHAWCTGIDQSSITSISVLVLRKTDWDLMAVFEMQKARAIALAMVEQHLSAATLDESTSQRLIIVDDNMYYRCV